MRCCFIWRHGIWRYGDVVDHNGDYFIVLSDGIWFNIHKDHIIILEKGDLL